MQRIIVIGAGLCGSLLAVRLAQKGFRVSLFEKRADMRKVAMSAGRSINLALSDRGIRGLRMVGLENELLRLAIPMRGRMIHLKGQEPVLQPYSGRQGEYINSISRGDLNIALLNLAEGYDNIDLHFNMGCTHVNLKEGVARFQDEANGGFTEVRGSLIVGTDGAGSAVRESMMAEKGMRFNYSQQFLDYGYKELVIPPGPGGSFQMEKHALHIWPRGTFMMIALPNPAGDYTATIFLPFRGENGFDSLDSESSLLRFFEATFPDALAVMPTLVEDYFQHPVGILGTIKCSPWHTYGKTLLMGDAAHAVVPFYGQGMNCSFEDVVVFDEMLEQHGDNWPVLLEAFDQSRKVNADAIADLAVENFIEMRDLVADPVFQRKRILETRLEQTYPDYFSKYSLVTFREDVSYYQAMTQGRRQDGILMDICASLEHPETADLGPILARLRG